MRRALERDRGCSWREGLLRGMEAVLGEKGS